MITTQQSNIISVDLTSLVKLINDLYEEIKHGDDEHKRWLKDKIDDFVKRKITG